MGKSIKSNVEILIETTPGAEKLYGLKDAQMKFNHVTDDDSDFDTSGETIIGFEVGVTANVNLKDELERKAYEWMEDQVFAEKSFFILVISKSRKKQYRMEVSVELSPSEAAKQKATASVVFKPVNVYDIESLIIQLRR